MTTSTPAASWDPGRPTGWDSPAELTGQDIDTTARILDEVELVLTRLSPAAADEINQILAEHHNHGGLGLLIDQVQLAAATIKRRLYNNN